MPQTIGNHNYQIYAKNSSGVYSSPVSVNLNVINCSNGVPGIYEGYAEFVNGLLVAKIARYRPDGNINKNFATFTSPSIYETFNPGATTSDSNGNIYIVARNRILKSTPQGGTMTIFATLPGSSDRYIGLQKNSVGDLITVNQQGNTIYKISPTGIVTNYGNIAIGNSNFDLDSQDNIYLMGGGAAGQNDRKVQKVTPGGVVTSFNLGYTAAGLVVDRTTGDVFVAKLTNPGGSDTGRIAKISQNGTVNNNFATVTLSNFSRNIFIDSNRNGFIVSIGGAGGIIKKINLDTGVITDFTPPSSTPQFITSSIVGVQGFDTQGNLYVNYRTLPLGSTLPFGGAPEGLYKISTNGTVTNLSSDFITSDANINEPIVYGL